MQFKEIAQYVGVTDYPETFENIYQALIPGKTEFGNPVMLEKYEQEYEVLQQYYEIAVTAVLKLRADKKLFIYGAVLCEYIKHCSTLEARCVPLPKQNGTLERDFFALFLMYTAFPGCVDFYRSRGFSQAEIKQVLSHIRPCITLGEKETGRPILTDVYYNWTMLYIYGELIHCGNFSFQNKIFSGDAILLKNKLTGEYVPMMTDGRFHRNGLVLGTAGSEDPEGSFPAEFTETPNSFVGHPVLYNRVSPKKTVYPKDIWECVLRPNEHVIAVHIARKADISRDTVLQAFREGALLAGRQFPDCNPHFLVCYSWLLDPTLAAILPQSKIAQFGEVFLRFPVMSRGTEYKMFVFPGHDGPNDTLPEDTTLQRKIKQHLISGGHIHFTAGIYTKL